VTSDQEIYTPAEVSRLFRVDPKTVTRWAAAGKLKSFKTPGGHRRFFARDVRALLARGGRPDAVEQDTPDQPVNAAAMADVRSVLGDPQ
jgi:excisionase family DNA binding protein